MSATPEMSPDEKREFLQQQIDTLTPPLTNHQQVLLTACRQLLDDINISEPQAKDPYNRAAIC